MLPHITEDAVHVTFFSTISAYIVLRSVVVSLYFRADRVSH